MVWKLDRLGRSLKHLIETVTGLSDRGVGFQSLQQFPPYGFSSEKTLVLISHFANPSRKMLLWTSHLNTWTDGVARHGACSR